MWVTHHIVSHHYTIRNWKHSKSSRNEDHGGTRQCDDMVRAAWAALFATVNRSVAEVVGDEESETRVAKSTARRSAGVRIAR